MRLSATWTCLSLIILPLYSQTCPYQTVAGPARSFVGDGIDAKSARLSGPSRAVVADDGTIYFSDTWNHRIRRVDPAGVIHTLAGTGERAFKGDNGAALQAAFNQPTRLALASDGSLYISDTGNSRVRKISPNGTISTVAGNGHNRYSGDGGPGPQAALNAPTALALDAKGNLYILDSGNWRVRMLAPDGTISTVAGAGGDEDYSYLLQTLEQNPTPQPAVQARISGLRDIAVDRNSILYLALDSMVFQVGADGIIRPLTATSGGTQNVSDPTPVGSVQASGTVLALKSGALLLSNGYQFVSVENGTARPVPSACASCNIAEDVSSGAFILTFLDHLYRQAADGTATLLAGEAQTDQAFNTPAYRSIWAAATAPDGTVYVANRGAHKVYAVQSDGTLKPFAGGDPQNGAYGDGGPALEAAIPDPVSLAPDSKGNIYIVDAQTKRVRRVDPQGVIHTVMPAGSGLPLAVRVDGQDRVYVFLSEYSYNLVLRLKDDGTFDTVIDRGFLGGAVTAYTFPGMTVAKDGTVYVGQHWSVGEPDEIVVSGPQSETPQTLTTEVNVTLRGMAADAQGRLYITDGTFIRRVEADGTLITVANRDRRGFQGEYGFDSAGPTPFPSLMDLSFDPTGRLMFVQESYAVRRVQPAACPADPAPLIGGIVEGATFRTDLALAAGQVFSIFGKRLGPADGVQSRFDEHGNISTALGGTSVYLNGVAAPLLFAGQGQINAIVPFNLDGDGTLNIEVESAGVRSEVNLAPLEYFGPGIFSYQPATSNSDRYASMLNQDLTQNSADRPAKSGTIGSLWVTGLGQTNPPGADAAISVTPKTPTHPVKLFVNDQEAHIAYVGIAPGMVEGVMQLNFEVPVVPSAGPARIEIRMGTPEGSVRTLFYAAP